MFKTLLKITVIVLLAITVFHPDRHAKHYRFIAKHDTLNELVESRRDRESNLRSCVYNKVLSESKEIGLDDINTKNNYIIPRKGGEYSPKSCRPLYKSAIIVPYRDREEQLNIFINYFHAFLQKQNLHYRIFIVDQRDNAPFNRGRNLNVGAAEAINAGYPCLILHDVDLIPLVSGNIYACTRQPRHMSSCVDKFRFQVPYRELFGGVVAINTNQFTKINGFSNQYDGWGGEDDDFYRRLVAQNFSTCRFSPELSRYTMLKHKKAVPSENRYNLLNKALQRQSIDGLNSLAVPYSVEEKPLYTHIIIT